MERGNTPYIGAWYETEGGDLLVVLAHDPAHGWVDVQFATGRVERLDTQAWLALEAQSVEPAEEWHASMDDFQARRPRKTE